MRSFKQQISHLDNFFLFLNMNNLQDQISRIL